MDAYLNTSITVVSMSRPWPIYLFTVLNWSLLLMPVSFF